MIATGDEKIILGNNVCYMTRATWRQARWVYERSLILKIRQ
ncbi:hypothetical protein CDAR_192301, partial [Caerostris darwini]